MNPDAVLAWLVAEMKSVPGLSSGSSRMFPNRAPEGTGVPCIVWQILDAPAAEKLDPGPAKTGTISIQIRIYAHTWAISMRMREAARQAFQDMPAQDMDGGDWRLDGTEISDFNDTFEKETETHGALFVLHLHVSEP